jgi:hypothetical protein
MFGLAAFFAFLIGFFVSHAYQHPGGGSFWLFLGLMLAMLHITFGSMLATRRQSNW